MLTGSAGQADYRRLVRERDSRLPPAGVRVEFVEEPSEEEALGWSCLMHCYSARVLERLRELYPDGGPELIEFPDFLGEGFVTLGPPRRWTHSCGGPGSPSGCIRAPRCAASSTAISRAIPGRGRSTRWSASRSRTPIGCCGAAGRSSPPIGGFTARRVWPRPPGCATPIAIRGLTPVRIGTGSRRRCWGWCVRGGWSGARVCSVWCGRAARWGGRIFGWCWRGPIPRRVRWGCRCGSCWSWRRPGMSGSCSSPGVWGGSS